MSKKRSDVNSKNKNSKTAQVSEILAISEISEDTVIAPSANDLSLKAAPIERSLEEALEEWAPDAEIESDEESDEDTGPSATFETSTQGSAPASNSGTVTFISDPFSICTNDITAAQNDSEFEIADEDLDLADDEEDAEQVIEESETDHDAELPEPAEMSKEETEETFANLSAAMAVEEDKLTQNLKDMEPAQAQAAAERLAEQIAEDLELAAVQANEQIEALAAEGEEMDEELRAALPSLPQSDENGNLDMSEMEACIETLLFMMDKPVSTEKLRELLGPEMPHSIFQEALTSLRDRYQKTHHGFEIVEIGGGFQFRTKAGRAALAKKLAKVSTHRLSSGAMETLAIIAYRQPVLKDEIDKVRGVDSSHFVRGLMEKKLIRISGRSELVGRPMLYSTSPEFLEVFGLKDLAAMPSLHELEQMIPASQSRNPDDEDPRVKEMRRLVAEMKSDGSTRLNYDPKEDEKFLKDIRDRVNAIQTSTPSIEEGKAAEKEAADFSKRRASGMLTPAEMERLNQELDGAAMNSPEQPDLSPEV
ncbi:MAG: SMC-Scp complex subunit ScpB [Methylotenera sp.]|nr:SMC-Scp complex subunit ScpB [Oligoflexia bacterium]